MLHLVFLVALTATFAGCDSSLLDAGTVRNSFIVKYNFLADPTHRFNYYIMPLTVDAAKRDQFTQVLANENEKTTTWCRNRDFRVCVLFDQQKSVAGIQLSVRVNEIKGRIPYDLAFVPEWRQQTFLGEDVYSATVFFLQKEKIPMGRRMSAHEETIVDGIYILQTNTSGAETNRLHVPIQQEFATKAGFTEQSCFFGMGKHYFLNLRKSSTCEELRPYFILYGPKTKQINGFGFVQYGDVTQGRRSWFENPPAPIVKQIAPNSPDCITDWVKRYKMFSMHVYFVERPWFTRC